MGNPCVGGGRDSHYAITMTTQLLTVSPAVVRIGSRNTKNPAVLRPPPMRVNPPPSDPDSGSWRYSPGPGRSALFWPAVIASGALHLLAIFGFNDKAVEAPLVPAEDLTLDIVFMEMPPLEDLDPPEEIFDGDAPAEELDASAYVPMQADVPTVATNAVFVQQLDLRSLLPRPEFDAAAVMTIPPRIAHGGATPAGFKDVFDLADLDRVPEPILQPVPIFPHHLKGEVRSAQVIVDFIVDAKGKVPWAKVYSSTHRGFEDAAILGVSRWQFRPGVKNGKKVASRLRVPLNFRIVEDGN